VLTIRQATLCFSCGVGSPTIGEHDIVYILSNNRHLHKAAMHLQIIHLDELLCPDHCLKGLFEKATAPPQTENNTQIQKSTLHNR